MTKQRDYSRSEILYERALRTIPTATQTFSKSAQMFVRGAAPIFAERARGCRLWDVDGNVYFDYVLGLLPVVLGYGDSDVDAAIRDQLGRGITFSLATELEAELAERLVRLVPCAEMVRFGKNGTDATSAAVRLARAHTGRDRVAVCGYHGWQDWYIGTTVRHLGVPDAVRSLSATFRYNDADSLAVLLKAEPDGYAAVILEPMTFEAPAKGFLEEVRELSERYGCLLIFDEIITGFRLALGGAQEAFGVIPDLACFGKAMGNGMPISAVVGRAEIMTLMEDIFFSGTFGGEALSLAASVATIDKLETGRGIARIHSAGRRLARGVGEILTQHDLDPHYRVVGGDWWPAVLSQPQGQFADVLLTSLLRQELVANGLLILSAFNISVAHDDDQVIDETLAAWRRAAATVSAALRSKDPSSRLIGPPIEPVFEVRPRRDPGTSKKA